MEVAYSKGRRDEIYTQNIIRKSLREYNTWKT
jgi:hypothetical protein